jgi:hypothetical protein
MKLIWLEYYRILAVIFGSSYRVFREFSLFTKIFVISGGLLAEFMIISIGLVTSNSFWVRAAEVLTFHFLVLMFLIKKYNIIQIKKNSKLELENAELTDEEKAALESERMHVNMLEVTGLPVPMALRPEESKYRKKMESIEIESRKRDKRGFAEHPSNEEKDIREQKE